MATAGQIAQSLLARDPQKNVGRMALYHYLKNWCRLDVEATVELFTDFWQRALHIPYWQNNRAQLIDSIRSEFQHLDSAKLLGFDQDDVLRPMAGQLLNIESSDEMQLLLSRKKNAEGGRHKLILLREQKILSLHLSTDDVLTVEIYAPTVYVFQGELHTLVPITHLQYNQQMELSENYEHWLESSIMTTTCFQVAQSRFTGLSLRGYTFQRTESFNAGLGQIPELFYALKSLEQYYVHPHSDPFYKELTTYLEKVTRTYNDYPAPDTRHAALEAVKKGRMVLKNIFPNDNLLRLLVTNLEFLLEKQDRTDQRPQNIEESCPQISPLG